MAENLPSRKRRHKEQRDWSSLPSHVLGRIFSFLSRKDQTKMSLVCRRWSDGFETPEVWKVFKVSHSDFIVGSPVMKFANRFSNKFKRVKIKIRNIMELSWFNYLNVLLEALTTQSILYSFKFVFQVFFIGRYRTERYRNFFVTLGKLLSSQRHLKRLELYHFRLKYKVGVDLIKKAYESSGDSLKHLVLREFVDYHSIFEEQDLANPFQLPGSLSFLKIDYELLFGILDANQSHANKILQNCNGELVLDIFVNGKALRFEGLQIMPPSEWRNLKQRFPALEVQLNVTLSVNHQQYPPAFFIVEDMPITRLAYHFKQTPLPIADFLQLLRSSRVTDHLESLYLRWPVAIADIDTIFNPFLIACRKLKVLNLETVHPTNSKLMSFVQDVFVNHPESLVEFSLRLKCCYRKCIPSLNELEPLFKSVNIDFKPTFYGLDENYHVFYKTLLQTKPIS